MTYWDNPCMYTQLSAMSATQKPVSYSFSKGAKIRNRYNQVPHLTQDTNGHQLESEKLTIRHHKREPRGQPIPSRRPQINRYAHRHNKHKTEKNMNYPQNKYRLGMVCKNILMEGLNRFPSANLTLNSDVDQDT